MKKPLLFLLYFIYSSAHAAARAPQECLGNQQPFILTATSIFLREAGISADEIQPQKTKITLLKSTFITEKQANYYAWKDHHETDSLTQSMISIKYSYNNVQNVVVELDYQNRKKQHNIIWATALISDKSCLVRFNGYLMVKRQF